MKNFIIPLVIISLLLFSSCKENKSNDSVITEKTTTINGIIKNANEETIFLQKLTPNNLINIDSISLPTTGDFKFEFTNNQTEFYRLILNQDAIFLIINPNEDIQINAKGPYISRNYTIDGSPESGLAKKMNAHLVNTADSLQSLNNYFKSESNKASVNKQALFQEVNKTAESLFSRDKAFLSELIKTHEESLFIYLALYQSLGRTPLFNYPEDKETFNFVLQKLETYHPESGFTKSLKSDMNKMQMQIDQQTSSNQSKLNIGDIAPDIMMENPQGELLNLHSLKGQYVLLDFWASWCRPCRMENPNLVKEYNKYHADGFTIFQVSLDKTHDDWVKGIKDDNLSAWLHVSDLNYWNNAAAKMYGVQSIPSSYLLDTEGKIIGINLRGQALGNKLKEIFGH